MKVVQHQTRTWETQILALLRDLGQVTSPPWTLVSIGASSVPGTD